MSGTAVDADGLADKTGQSCAVPVDDQAKALIGGVELAASGSRGFQKINLKTDKMDMASPASPNETKSSGKSGECNQSVTEYDIDRKKRCDITLSGARRVILAGDDGEKLGVRLASGQIADIQSAFKVRIGDIKNRIDVDMRRFGDMTEAAARRRERCKMRSP